MQSGRFRHEVTLLRRVDAQQPGGQVKHSYTPLTDGTVWARIAPITGREYFAASQIQSEVTTRITIRWRDDVDETCRVRHVIDHTTVPAKFDDYDVKAVLPDEKSGRRELVLMCVKAPADGWRNTVIVGGGGEPLPGPGFEIPWSWLVDVPTEFTPAAHNHPWGDLTDVPTEFPPEAHNHPWGDLTDVPTEFTPAAHNHPWGDLTDVPTEFPPEAHNHPWGDLTDVPTEFTPAAHNHPWGDLTDVPTEFPPSSHSHDHGALSGLADDDHTQYLLANGSRDLTGSQNTQALLPVADDAHAFGSASLRYSAVYATGLQVVKGVGATVTRGDGSAIIAAVTKAAGATAILTANPSATGYTATVFGAINAGDTSTARLVSTGLGAIVSGVSVGAGTGNTTFQATGSGAAAFGLASSGNAVAPAVLEATSVGGFAQGVAAGGVISARISVGTLARGYAAGGYSIIASGFGSFASGAVLGGDLTASGDGAFALGNSAWGSIVASGPGAVAIGCTITGVDIVASAANATQLGPGTNAIADSLRVGSAGLHLKGTVGAFAAPANGQIWVDAGGVVNIRSGGVTKTI